jgi:D-sedoheptulose 7-phosphate isomerase
MNSSTINQYLDRINATFEQLDQISLQNSLIVLREIMDSGGRIWVAGNGGSAATASHFATDLSRCKNSWGAPVKGISLCDNSGLITAIANDFGFDLVFLNQLSNEAVAGDLLVVLSASGNSKNLLLVMEWAKENGLKTLAMTGFDGGRAREFSDFSLHMPTAIGDYGVAEDAHSILCHFLSSQFRTSS